MKMDLIIEFILNGMFKDIPFSEVAPRMTLIRKYGEIKGFNKKNRIYEILKKDNVLFYLGFGARGKLEGVRICDVLSLKIDYTFIEKLLQTNNISYEFNTSKMICVLENDVKIYFDEDRKYIIEILKTENQMIEKKLLAV
jgi:hypothetical protein